MTLIKSTQSDLESQRSAEFSDRAKPLSDEPVPAFSRIDMLDSVSTYRQSAPGLELSAVFCPTNRGAGGPIPGLFLAKQAAERTGAELRIFRSGKAIERNVPDYVLPRTSQPTLVIDLPRHFHSPLLPNASTDMHPMARHRKTDTPLKRNLSLVLSILLGDETVFNIDDDIMTRPGSIPYPSGDLNQKELRIEDALADLEHHPDRHVIGWLIRDQNDHSVVHHVLADLGHESNAIIGSGAQVIRSSPHLPFHPNVYNEDLLFLLPLLLSDNRRSPFGAAACAGVLHQQHSARYDRKRAESEELADVLIEGLLHLVEHQPDEVIATSTTREFWEDFLWHRQNQIRSALDANRLGLRGPREMSPMSRERDEALMTASAVHSTTRKGAKKLARFVHLWQSDLALWSEFLHGIRPKSGERLSMTAAVEVLGLTDHARWIPAKGLVPRQLQPVAKCG